MPEAIQGRVSPCLTGPCDPCERVAAEVKTEIKDELDYFVDDQYLMHRNPCSKFFAEKKEKQEN